MHKSNTNSEYEHATKIIDSFIHLLARLLILIKKGGLLQKKFGVGVNIYLWAR